MQEIWKDIDGYEGLYKVSSMGRVYSVPRISPTGCKVNGRFLCHGDNGHGYKIVNLWKDGKSKIKYVHRLVALAFIPNPDNLPEINHKDENKENNCVSNLEWCSNRYNVTYGTARKRGMATYRQNGHNTPIDKYDTSGNLIKTYEVSYDLRKDGVKRRCVLNCCYGRTRSYKGFVYRFHGEPFGYRPKSSNHYKVMITKFDCNGNVVAIYNSISSAEKANGLGRNALYSYSYAWSRDAVIGGYVYKRKMMEEKE